MQARRVGQLRRRSGGAQSLLCLSARARGACERGGVEQPWRKCQRATLPPCTPSPPPWAQRGAPPPLLLRLHPTRKEAGRSGLGHGNRVHGAPRAWGGGGRIPVAPPGLHAIGLGPARKRAEGGHPAHRPSPRASEVDGAQPGWSTPQRPSLRAKGRGDGRAVPWHMAGEGEGGGVIPRASGSLGARCMPPLGSCTPPVSEYPVLC
ncbi:hypothetical protein EI94DRAFT_733526 [Lactarius quietus]|nr:hypothetical protein EI94DRAFT_733526 [Lactarius quietus]